MEVKPGDAVTALTESWAVERFIPMVKGEDKKRLPGNPNDQPRLKPDRWSGIERRSSGLLFRRSARQGNVPAMRSAYSPG